MSMRSPGSASPWLNEGEELAWRAFRRMMISVRAGTARDLAGTGLSEPDYEVLSTLVERPEVTSALHEQASKMDWSRSRLSRHASRMEARGLIRRAPDPADGRGCLLILTRLGRDVLRSAAPAHLTSVRRHFADLLGPEDLVDLLRIAGKLTADDGPTAEPESGR